MAYWIEYEVPHIIVCSNCDYGTSVKDKKLKICPECGAEMNNKLVLAEEVKDLIVCGLTELQIRMPQYDMVFNAIIKTVKNTIDKMKDQNEQ